MGNLAGAGGIRFGHRVLETSDNSPARKANMVPYLDFVVAINDVQLDNEECSLVKMVLSTVDVPAKFTLYNVKTRALRDETITPKKGWGGPGVLGLVARYDAFALDADYMLQITDVMPDSPASLVGLRKNEDFIVGSEKVTFHNIGKLDDVLRRSVAQTMVINVYNSALDNVRPVAIIPHASWPGGITKKEGAHWPLLGCGVAYGPKNTIPDTCRTTNGWAADVTDVGLMTAVNIERLSKLGKLMDRTIADRDGSGAVVPLPPPPPPAFPDPPTYEEEEPEEKASIASSGVARMGDFSESDGDGSGSGGDSDADSSAPKKPVLTSSEMTKAITASGLGSLNRTRGLGTHRMTRGANRRLSQAAARKQKLEAQGRLAGGGGTDGPVDFMYRTAEERRREEELERQQFVMSNPLSC